MVCYGFCYAEVGCQPVLIHHYPFEVVLGDHAGKSPPRYVWQVSFEPCIPYFMSTPGVRHYSCVYLGPMHTGPGHTCASAGPCLLNSYQVPVIHSQAYFFFFSAPDSTQQINQWLCLFGHCFTGVSFNGITQIQQKVNVLTNDVVQQQNSVWEIQGFQTCNFIVLCYLIWQYNAYQGAQETLKVFNFTSF